MCQLINAHKIDHKIMKKYTVIKHIPATYMLRKVYFLYSLIEYVLISSVIVL